MPYIYLYNFAGCYPAYWKRAIDGAKNMGKYMTLQEAMASQPPATPEGVWEILQEVGRKQEETDRLIKEVGRKNEETGQMLKESIREHDQRMKETDQRMKENARQQEETDRQMKETDRRMKEYNKRFGDFTNRFGEMVEYMVAPNLCEKFREYGYYFDDCCRNFHPIGPTGKKHNIRFEVDIMLQNGDKAMLVEVKSKLETADVREHIGRLEKMRRYADLRGDKRSFWGAVAGVVIEDQVKEYALGEGLFVIEPSGETFNITTPENCPKEW
jgi:hypothetical protein